jgi:transcriptional regulator with XRE-family HTH domain
VTGRAVARHGLTARRRALGLTQDDLSEALRVERSTVARWEQGATMPRPGLRRRLASILELTPDELTRLLDPPAPTPSDDRPDDLRSGWDENAGAAMGRAAPKADADYVESVRENGRRLIELDTHYGGDDLAQVAVRAFKTTYQRLASGLYVPSAESDLRAAVGELGQVAAWIAYDADKQPLSRQLTNEALLISRLAGDRSTELFELAQLAMQSVHLGRAAEALQLSDEIIDSYPPSPRVTAIFRIRRARALALMGDRTRALSEHARAESALADGISHRDPNWTWWADPAELAWHRAMSLASLDELPAAVELFHEAWERRPPHAHRARYNDAAHLLEAQVNVGAWHDAEAPLAAILAGATEVNSARTTALLRRVVRQLEHRRHTIPPSLSDSLHALRQILDAAP